ncbi:TonB-dependent receptor [Gloeocapsopsis sp. AAB1 = 1H9]|uniref:TonB-dependent receptor n=2 Tax=Gloeocapsopsis TaxID=693222 RepID=A0A6N8FY31_9CHRO|nr:TonB-dependent receptor [Gloeocapsopsis dulcis]MUL37871.1 TonB-dependent receptor [Gloeocapsopsis dulcis AAB1 = 1H9]
MIASAPVTYGADILEISQSASDLLEADETAIAPPLDWQQNWSIAQSSEPTLVESDIESIRITVTDRILDQPVYGPFRREATVRESTRPVYVINREQIEAQGARTVQEALRYLPGILSDGTAGGQLGALSSQFIRGANSAQVLILLDGRPINDVGFFGGFDLSNFTTDAVERIELLPGGGSTLYGSDALGGVINIITRSPSETPEVTARGAIGSFGLNEQSIQARGSSGDVGWALGYSRIESNNDFPFRIDRIDLDDRRRNADVLYNNLNLNLEKLGDRDTLSFSAIYQTKIFGVAGGIPIPNSIGAFNTLTPDAEQYTDEVLLGLTWRSRLGNGEDSLLTSRIFTDFLQYNYNNPDPATFGTRDDVNRRSLGVQVQHNWHAANQTLTYGVDYRNTRSRNTTFSYSTGVTDINYDGDIHQGALFASYEVNFSPSFSVNLGARQDFNSLVNGSFTSPSIGAQLVLSPSTTLRANYARSFRAPQISNLEGLAAFNVVGNPDLAPETGDSIDIGIDQQLGDIGLFRLTAFSNHISNLINFRFGSPSTYENIGQVRTLGLEADLNLQLSRYVYAFAHYTLNEPRITEDRDSTIEGNILSFRDANQLNVGLVYETPIGVYAAVILRNLSDFFVNNTNTESLSGFTAIDLRLRVPLNETVVLNGSVDNVFDRQSEQFPGYPAVGRSFRLGVSATF